MKQVKLTLPDDVADWLDSELGASHGTRGTVAGDIVQAAFHACRDNYPRQLRFKHRKLCLSADTPYSCSIERSYKLSGDSK